MRNVCVKSSYVTALRLCSCVSWIPYLWCKVLCVSWMSVSNRRIVHFRGVFYCRLFIYVSSLLPYFKNVFCERVRIRIFWVNDIADLTCIFRLMFFLKSWRIYDKSICIFKFANNPTIDKIPVYINLKKKLRQTSR